MSGSNPNETRVVLVTGGTAGIGYQSALRLAATGMHVIITGRHTGRGDAAAASIRQETGNEHVRFMAADLSTTSGARQLAHRVMRDFERLDILVNNAGAMPSAERHLNDEGIQESFAVNVLAPFILSEELLPLLSASQDGQIIQITGGMPHAIAFQPDNMEGQTRYVGMMVYNHDKLAMMCLAYEQATRYESHGVRVNVAYPGGAKTPMTTGMRAGVLPWFMRPLFPVMRLIFLIAGKNSAARASRSTHFLATRKDGGESRQYIGPKMQTLDWPKPVLEADVRNRVWSYVEDAISRVDALQRVQAME